ncbi:MAG: DUF72 domain-containing protein [Ketobacteraceae bacterium]|nr:DUF72 domain-containing protein [Ketobacteraceae bacterium]
MGKKRGQLRIGTSGYHYDHWKSVFYPESIKKTEWFSYYSERFSTVEINNTFYKLPSIKTFESWHDQAPNNFRYAIKYSQYATHSKRLKDPEQPLETFLSNAEHLKSFLGPILVQLPGNWKANPDRLEAFLKAAPGRHRWTLEFRDPSWLNEDCYRILRDHNAALCIQDMLDDHPREITANWLYMRFHGDHYGGSYTKKQLRGEADFIKDHLDEGRDVYVYFNNDKDGYAVQNALTLEELTG